MVSQRTHIVKFVVDNIASQNIVNIVIEQINASVIMVGVNATLPAVKSNNPELVFHLNISAKNVNELD